MILSNYEVRCIYYLLSIYCSMACAINLGPSVLLTGGAGGGYSLTTVSEYNEAGHVRDLPSLLQGRYGHGCSSYENVDGSKVSRY